MAGKGRPKGVPKTGGRQKGTPNKTTVSGREIALQWGPAALKRLAHLGGLIMDDEGKPIGMARTESVVAQACAQITDRAYGKATQPISGDDDMPEIRAALKVAFVRPNPIPPKG